VSPQFFRRPFAYFVERDFAGTMVQTIRGITRRLENDVDKLYTLRWTFPSDPYYVRELARVEALLSKYRKKEDGFMDEVLLWADELEAVAFEIAVGEGTT